LDFVYSILASVNKHRWPAPHPLDVRYHLVLDEPSTELIIVSDECWFYSSLFYIPIARSTKKKFPWCIWSLRQLTCMNILPGKQMRYYA
jgi:hypothetical protein